MSYRAPGKSIPCHYSLEGYNVESEDEVRQKPPVVQTVVQDVEIFHV